VLDEGGRPNATGGYVHKVDRHGAPLDPNFLGAGSCVTPTTMAAIASSPSNRAPNLGGNHPDAWRPNHIHFSLFGECFASRLVTQMYFPGDPLLAFDPIFQGAPEQARRAPSLALHARRQ
jgi:protocatechuate 3,4-dioxygenase beta subunit